MSLSLYYWYPWSGVVLDILSIPDFYTLTYFVESVHVESA